MTSDDAQPEADGFDFEQAVEQALDELPDELRRAVSNLTVVVEQEPPEGMPLLGLYQGIPLTRRTSSYGAVLPDKITIYRGPLDRQYGEDTDLLGQQIRRVVRHEVAHHFGISDERLHELDRY
jgi:predicted Zn-dependent protease with MMP-like domain